MKFIKTIALLAAALLLVACGETGAPGRKFATVDITGVPWGKDFHFTDHNGQPRSLADFKGKAVVLFFGYTNCPDMCPTTMYKLSQVMKKLGSNAQRVQVLMATLDPKRDTPDILRKYVPAFDPTFLGMYADEQTTEQTAKDFKVFYQKQKPDASGFYTIDHMGPAFLFDPQGRLRLFASDQHTADAIAGDLRTLLKEAHG